MNDDESGHSSQRSIRSIPLELQESHEEISNSDVGESRFASFLYALMLKEADVIRLSKVAVVMRNRVNEPAIVQLWRPTLNILCWFMRERPKRVDKSLISECLVRVVVVVHDKIGWSVCEKLFGIATDPNRRVLDKAFVFVAIRNSLIKLIDDHQALSSKVLTQSICAQIQTSLESAKCAFDVYELSEILFRLIEKLEPAIDTLKLALDHTIGWFLDGIDCDQGLRTINLLNSRVLASLYETALDYVIERLLCRVLAVMEAFMTCEEMTLSATQNLCRAITILDWICLRAIGAIGEQLTHIVAKTIYDKTTRFHSKTGAKHTHVIAVYTAVNRFFSRLSESINIPIDEVMNFVAFQFEQFKRSTELVQNAPARSSDDDDDDHSKLELTAEFDRSLIELTSLCLSFVYDPRQFGPSVFFEDSYLWHIKYNHLTRTSPRSAQVLIMLYDILVRLSRTEEEVQMHVARESINVSAKLAKNDLYADSVIVFNLCVLTSVREKLSDECREMVIDFIDEIIRKSIDETSLSISLVEQAIRASICFARWTRFVFDPIVELIERTVYSSPINDHAFDWLAQLAAEFHSNRDLLKNRRFQRLVDFVFSMALEMNAAAAAVDDDERFKLKLVKTCKTIGTLMKPFIGKLCELYERNIHIDVCTNARMAFHAIAPLLPTHMLAECRPSVQLKRSTSVSFDRKDILNFIVEGYCGNLETGCIDWRFSIREAARSLVFDRMESDYGIGLNTLAVLLRAFNDLRKFRENNHQTFKQYNLRLKLFFVLFENIQKSVGELIDNTRLPESIMPGQSDQAADYYTQSQHRFHEMFSEMAVPMAKSAVSHGYYSFAIRCLWFLLKQQEMLPPDIVADCTLQLVSCYIHLRMPGYLDGLKNFRNPIIFGDWMDGAKCQCEGSYEKALAIYKQTMVYLTEGRGDGCSSSNHHHNVFSGRDALIDFLNAQITKCTIDIDSQYEEFFDYLNRVEQFAKTHDYRPPPHAVDMNIFSVLASFSDRRFEVLRGTLTSMKSDSIDTDHYIRNFTLHPAPNFMDQLEAISCVKLIESACFKRFDPKCLEIATALIDSCICVDSIDPLGPNNFLVLDQILNARKQDILLPTINSMKLKRNSHRIAFMNFANRFAQNETSRYCEQLAHLARHHQNIQLAIRMSDLKSFEHAKLLIEQGAQEQVDARCIFDPKTKLNPNRLLWITRRMDNGHNLFDRISSELAVNPKLETERQSCLEDLDLAKSDQIVRSKLLRPCFHSKLSAFQHCLAAEPNNYKVHHLLAHHLIGLIENPSSKRADANESEELAEMAITHLRESIRLGGDTYDTLEVLKLLDNFPRCVNNVFAGDSFFPPNLWLRVIPQISYRYANRNLNQSEMLFLTKLVSSLAEQCPWAIIYPILRENPRHMNMFSQQILTTTKEFVTQMTVVALEQTQNNEWLRRLRQLFQIQSELLSMTAAENGAIERSLKKMRELLGFRECLDDIVNFCLSSIGSGQTSAEAFKTTISRIQEFLTEEGLKIERAKHLQRVSMSKVNEKLASLRDLCVGVPVCLEQSSHRTLRMIAFVDDEIEIFRSLSRPKRILFHFVDGTQAPFVLKCSHGLELEQRVMQMLIYGNHVLKKLNRTIKDTHHPSFECKTYDICLIGHYFGFVEMVNGFEPLLDVHLDYCERKSARNAARVAVRPDRGFQRRTDMADTFESRFKSLITNIEETPRDLISRRLYYSRNDGSTSTWLSAVMRYTRSTATISMMGMLLGLGDRHLNNILCDFKTGEIAHIDYNVCFDAGLALDDPETVPFRLTQNIRHAFGFRGLQGSFRYDCIKILNTLRTRGARGLDTLIDMCFKDSHESINNHLFKDELPKDFSSEQNLVSIRIGNRFAYLTKVFQIRNLDKVLGDARKAIGTYSDAIKATEKILGELEQMENVISYLRGAIRSNHDYGHDIHSLKRRYVLSKALKLRKGMLKNEIEQMRVRTLKYMDRTDRTHQLLAEPTKYLNASLGQPGHHSAIDLNLLGSMIDSELRELMATDCEETDALNSAIDNLWDENSKISICLSKISEYLQRIPEKPSKKSRLQACLVQLKELKDAIDDARTPPHFEPDFANNELIDSFHRSSAQYLASVGELERVNTQIHQISPDLFESFVALERQCGTRSWSASDKPYNLDWEIRLEQFVEIGKIYQDKWATVDALDLDRSARSVYDSCLTVFEDLMDLCQSPIVSSVIVKTELDQKPELILSNQAHEFLLREHGRLTATLTKIYATFGSPDNQHLIHECLTECQALDKHLRHLLEQLPPESDYLRNLHQKFCEIQSFILSIIEQTFTNVIPMIPPEAYSCLAGNLVLATLDSALIGATHSSLLLLRVQLMIELSVQHPLFSNEWDFYHRIFRKFMVDCLNHLSVGYPSLCLSLHSFISPQFREILQSDPVVAAVARDSELAHHVIAALMELQCQKKCSFGWMCGVDRCPASPRGHLRFEPITQVEVDALRIMDEFENSLQANLAARQKVDEIANSLKNNEIRLEQKLRWILGGGGASRPLHQSTIESFLSQKRERSRNIDELINSDRVYKSAVDDLSWLSSTRKLFESAGPVDSCVQTVSEIDQGVRDLVSRINSHSCEMSECEWMLVDVVGESALSERISESAIDRFTHLVREAICSHRAQLSSNRKRIDEINRIDKPRIRHNLIYPSYILTRAFTPLVNYMSIVKAMDLGKCVWIDRLLRAYGGICGRIKIIGDWCSGRTKAIGVDTRVNLHEMVNLLKQDNLKSVSGLEASVTRERERSVGLDLLYESLRFRLMGSGMSEEEQIDDAIESASSISNLSLLYEGWMAWF